MARKAKYKSKYVLIAILVMVAAFFVYFPSYSRYRELQSEADKLGEQVKTLQTQVEDLQREKQLIKNDKNYLETVIRKELGLVEPGEVVYEFEKNPRKTTNDQRLTTNVSTQTQKTAPQASN